jgi:hypothetical protein
MILFFFFLMIVLRASVPQDGVFFAGERFSCTITFTHEPERIKTQSPFPLRSPIEPFKQTPIRKTNSAEQIYDSQMGNLLNGMTRTLSLSTEFPHLSTVPRDSKSDMVPETIPEEESKPPLLPIVSPERIASETGGKVNLSLGVKTHRVISRQSSLGMESHTEDGTDPPSTNTPLSINTMISKGVTESISWCFAQIVGQFVVDSNYIKVNSLDSLQQKVMYKTPGSSSRSVGGGGSMSSSIAHHENSMKPVPNALPLYNTPPTILFCDEELRVGESKSYVYEILLPTVLPPSHRGKVIKFQYKLLIGIQKNLFSKVTQMVSIPFRFLNRTNRNGD